MASSPTATQDNDPRFSPTYPQRIHAGERAHWNAVLADWEQRISEAGLSLSTRGSRADLERLFAQMLGARDQLVDAVRRLPGESGALYHEDRHRVHEAVAALERLFSKW